MPVAQLLGGTTSVGAGTPNLSVSGVPVAATTERTPSNEKVSEHVQADPKRPQSQGEKNVREISFGGKTLPARVVLPVLAGIVAALVGVYVWTNRPNPHTDGGGATLDRGLPGKTSKAEPEEPKDRPKNQPVEKPAVEKSLVYLDSATGLSWPKSDNGRDVTWPQAQQYCENLSLGGYSDWRLPRIGELEKLYDPKVDGRYKIRKPFELTR
jgi:hypothetical protein